MAIISGTFFSPNAYPAFLRVIAEILPLTHYTELTRMSWSRNEHIWSNAGGSRAGPRRGAIGLVGALRGFRWQPQEG